MKKEYFGLLSPDEVNKIGKTDAYNMTVWDARYILIKLMAHIRAQEDKIKDLTDTLNHDKMHVTQLQSSGTDLVIKNREFERMILKLIDDYHEYKKPKNI